MQNGSQTRRVLVVDDEEAVADSLTAILNLRNYEARSAYSAEEAILIAREFHPQALVSDVVMNELTGIDLAVFFAQYYPACKVLLISGQIETAVLLEEAKSRGQVPTVLAKPLHPDEVLAFLADRAASA